MGDANCQSVGIDGGSFRHHPEATPIGRSPIDNTMFNRTDDSDDNGPWEAENDPAEEPIELTADLTVTADDTPECTIYPVDSTGIDRTATWISAADDSFTNLREWR